MLDFFKHPLLYAFLANHFQILEGQFNDFIGMLYANLSQINIDNEKIEAFAARF